MTSSASTGSPVVLPTPTNGRPDDADLASVPQVLATEQGGTLRIFELGLACCAVEFVVGAAAREELARLGANLFAGDPREANLMVVSGTVTDKTAPAVRRLYEQMPEPRYVMSFGSCANSGGPYWDSYCVTKGVDQVVPVDVYVPGCPPRPESLLQGIVKLREQIAARG